MTSNVAAFANAPLWDPISRPSYAPKEGVENFMVFRLRTDLLRSQLSSLPDVPQQAAHFSLPTPDGTLKPFLIWQTPIMEPGLAAKYPSIKTFTGYLRDNPLVTAKIDFNDDGVQFMVFNGRQTYLIEPYGGPDQNIYICYRKSDYRRPHAWQVQCEVADPLPNPIGTPLHLTPTGLPTMRLKTHGGDKRSYRLALACTGEYAVAVAGPTPTKSAVLAKMVTTMNRVNGIYEKEVGITMVLVANNDDLIYLNASNDPYSNFSGVAMMGQNQTNLDNVIGAANYDIGHVFSTGGGGVAEYQSVCMNNKGMGVTGQPNPQGDAFDVDFVAHEMGHQFGANHSFNSGVGGCGPNAVQTEAYEPGSGTTIMGYAGLCAQDNVQMQGNDYFHAISLLKITEFITDPNGASCGVLSNSGNNPPQVPSFSQLYHIPRLTPFALTAPEAIDADHQSLSYCWEQWDLGDFKKSFFQVRRSGPMFRSFSPDTARTRYFPMLDTLADGVTSYVGENLPDTNRSLVFKLTVRDVFNGAGTFNFSDDSIQLEVEGNVGPFEVLTPASSTVAWTGGNAYSVTWAVAGTDLPPVNCQSVNIYLSEDGGSSYPYLLKANTPNDGSESVLIPLIQTTNQARIMVRAADNVFFNINPVNFTVNDPSTVNEVSWDRQIAVYPVPADDAVNISITNNMRLQLTIRNTLGQPLWHGKGAKTFSVDVSQWPAGVYYLQMLEPNSGTRIVKPIVVR